MEHGMSIDQFTEGQTYETRLTMTFERIQAFAEATDDNNPIHMDEEFAKTTMFKTRIAQGMLTAGFISGVLGTRFPGVGTVYLSQSVRFLKPVFIGDEITVRATVLEILGEKNRLRLETVCLNQNGDTVLTGEALVMPPRPAAS